MSRMRADLLLLIVALIWGTAFIAQKAANDSMPPISFVTARFALSWAVIAPLAYYEFRRSDRSALTRQDVALTAFLGLCLFVGSNLQQIGLLTTTATNAGFLTALYVVLVPFTLWAMTGVPPRLAIVGASLMSICGAWLLTAKGELQHLTSGDVLMLISDVIWAVWLSLVPVFLHRANRPFFLAFAQFGIVTALGVIAALRFETVTSDGIVAAMPSIFYAGVLSGGVAYTLQIMAQRHTPAAEAALVMSLESVFAAVAGVFLLSERLTPLALLGCALILLGVIVVEAGPILQNLRLPSMNRKVS